MTHGTMQQRLLFKRLCEIARTTAGINLKEGKEALVAARLARRLRALGMDSAKEYLHLLENDVTGEEICRYIDAIATNFTSFFRESDHFDILREKLTAWQAEGKTRFRFWSAACATGEEPYSLAMTVQEVFQKHQAVDWKLLATDISSRALNKAIAGRYEAKALSSIPLHQRTTHFRPIPPDERGRAWFEVAPELRDKITFTRINLSKPPFPMQGPLDAVFCRNAMIYFTREVRQNLVRDIERLLGRGGILFSGHSESLAAMTTILKPIKPSVYIKP